MATFNKYQNAVKALTESANIGTDTRRMANDIATRPMSISAERQTQTHGTRRNIQTSKR